MMSRHRSDQQRKNSSSGQGALGMGGDPSDDPRDVNSGGGDRGKDQRKSPVPGAFGEGKEKKEGGTPEL